METTNIYQARRNFNKRKEKSEHRASPYYGILSAV